MKKVALALIAAGIICLVVGPLITAMGMVRDFHVVSGGGQMNQAVTGQQIGMALSVTMVGLTTATSGLVLWLLSRTRTKHQT